MLSLVCCSLLVKFVIFRLHQFRPAPKPLLFCPETKTQCRAVPEHLSRWATLRGPPEAWNRARKRRQTNPPPVHPNVTRRGNGNRQGARPAPRPPSPRPPAPRVQCYGVRIMCAFASFVMRAITLTLGKGARGMAAEGWRFLLSLIVESFGHATSMHEHKRKRP